ncbi:MAG: HAMP domain-containing sensor histidine kinase [Rhodospirillaceae bacterium]
MSGAPSATVWLVGGETPAGTAKPGWTRRERLRLAAAAGLAGLVVLSDSLTGFGTAVPVLYAGPLVLCRDGCGAGLLRVLALTAAALTMLGFGLAGPVTAAALVDRLLALAVIAASLVLLGRWRDDREALAEAVALSGRLARAKARFLSAASHDLRHPLQAAVLFHDLLTRRLRGTAQEDLVGGVGRALEMQRRMLDGLLEVSHLDAGQIDVCPVRYTLGTVFERLNAEFAPAAAQAGLTLTVVPTAAVVVTDPDLLYRILRNLLDNALKYTQRGGVVLGCRRRGHMVSIQVCDTGIGIPDDRLREVFEEFQQLRVLVQDGGKGLGLGLTVAERLARAIGHPLGVRSVVGRGTLFEVVVPRAGG